MRNDNILKCPLSDVKEMMKKIIEQCTFDYRSTDKIEISRLNGNGFVNSWLLFHIVSDEKVTQKD